jgi:predicted porin
MYADWLGQIQYSSPNWNGFQFTVAARQPFANSDNNNLGFDGKVTYDFTGDVSGRVWAGFVSQRHENSLAAATRGGQNDSYTSRGYDVGARVAVSDFGLVGYFYDGRGLDTQLLNALTVNSLGGLQMLAGNKSDDKGGYVQATYKIPTGTKLGVSYGRNRTEANNNAYDIENRSWIVGAYHPLTKSLNLVAEYTSQKVDEDRANINLDAKTVSLGAILFF